MKAKSEKSIEEVSALEVGILCSIFPSAVTGDPIEDTAEAADI